MIHSFNIKPSFVIVALLMGGAIVDAAPLGIIGSSRPSSANFEANSMNSNLQQPNLLQSGRGLPNMQGQDSLSNLQSPTANLASHDLNKPTLTDSSVQKNGLPLVQNPDSLVANDVKKPNVANSNIQEPSLSNLDLKQPILASSGSMDEPNFANTGMRKDPSLSNVNLKQTSLASAASIDKPNLADTNMNKDPSLSNVDLKQPILASSGDIQKPNLANANLPETDLASANVKHTNLADAKIQPDQGANVLNVGSKLPIKGSKDPNGLDADVDLCDLAGVNGLVNANCKQAAPSSSLVSTSGKKSDGVIDAGLLDGSKGDDDKTNQGKKANGDSLANVDVLGSKDDGSDSSISSGQGVLGSSPSLSNPLQTINHDPSSGSNDEVSKQSGQEGKGSNDPTSDNGSKGKKKGGEHPGRHPHTHPGQHPHAHPNAHPHSHPDPSSSSNAGQYIVKNGANGGKQTGDASGSSNSDNVNTFIDCSTKGGLVGVGGLNTNSCNDGNGGKSFGGGALSGNKKGLLGGLFRRSIQDYSDEAKVTGARRDQHPHAHPSTNHPHPSHQHPHAAVKSLHDRPERREMGKQHPHFAPSHPHPHSHPEAHGMHPRDSSKHPQGHPQSHPQGHPHSHPHASNESITKEDKDGEAKKAIKKDSGDDEEAKKAIKDDDEEAKKTITDDDDDEAKKTSKDDVSQAKARRSLLEHPHPNTHPNATHPKTHPKTHHSNQTLRSRTAAPMEDDSNESLDSVEDANDISKRVVFTYSPDAYSPYL